MFHEKKLYQHLISALKAVIVLAAFNIHNNLATIFGSFMTLLMGSEAPRDWNS